MEQGADRSRRADAQFNYEQIVEAATAVFAERGLAASVGEIAARAGVGRATIYRSFPSKHDLAAAVAINRIARFTESVERALASDDDPWPAFVALLHDFAEQQARDRIVTEAIHPLVPEELVAESRARFHARLTAFVERAQAQGCIDSDATTDQLVVLITGTGRLLAQRGERDMAVWYANADLIARAVRAG